MSLHPGDKSAAFTGLVGGLILVVVMCVAIVMWTNSLFEGHAAAPAAGAPATTH
jgi:hypothetical protein